MTTSIGRGFLTLNKKHGRAAIVMLLNLALGVFNSLMVITASKTDARLPIQWETEDGNFLELRPLRKRLKPSE
jgi:hypothetical protein